MSKNTVWTSPATRNIQLCIDKNEEVKSIKAELVRLIHRPINQQDVRRFVRDHLKSIHEALLAGTSGEIYSIEDINWQEIAEVWEEERHEHSNRQR
jgi:hypothetical protein